MELPQTEAPDGAVTAISRFLLIFITICDSPSTPAINFNGGWSIVLRIIFTMRGALFSTFALAVHASQPGAISPVAGPLRNLTWGQLNFLHTTDTHGWLAGHLLEYVLPPTHTPAAL
jgi:hypothetical protein